MAIPKRARVISSEKWNEEVCHVRCEMIDPLELGFIGGQYVIVNSGIRLPNGSMGKRAYSIASADRDQMHFDLIVRRISGGVGSHFIHGLKPGEVFEFSGPWGKFLPPNDDRKCEILVMATDTGLTAGLGLIRGGRFASFLPRTKFICFINSEAYFIPFNQVSEWIPSALSDWRWILSPAVGDPGRLQFCQHELERIIERNSFDWIYMSGDGSVIQMLTDWLLAKGYSEGSLVSEPFFNQLARKAPSAQTINSRVGNLDLVSDDRAKQ